MEKFKTAVAFILFFSAVMVVFYFLEKSEHNYIEVWATKHGYSGVEIDKRILTTPGPYYFGKSIYRAKVKDKEGKTRTFWFRNDIGFNSVEEELPNGKYKKVE